jgi:pyruvate formate lyase activating enzyme
LEKNPLYHVAPGSAALATATAGCNLTCTYCQNWDISQVGPDKTRNLDLTPEALVGEAGERGLKWLTFSYTEPVAYLEYALEAARLARQRGLKVAVVTAGIINPKPLAKLMENADAFSVTLKGYNQEFYRNVCGANLEDVWQTLRALNQAGKWLEVVTLIVPGLNDEEKGIRELAGALAKLSRDIPWHFLRFSPAYKLKHLPSTPVATLEMASRVARQAGLRYVYLSNLPGHSDTRTVCPACSKILIERVGFKILNNQIRSGRCPGCGLAIPGLDFG